MSMRWMTRLACPLLMGFALQGLAAQDPVTVGLQEVLERGREDLPALRAAALADANGALAQASDRQWSWPTIGFNSTFSRSDSVAVIGTPFGNLQAGDKEQYRLQAYLRQPLLRESARLKARSDAQQFSGGRLRADREAESRAFAAAKHYFGLLRLQAAAQAYRSLERSLQGRSKRLQELLAAGKVLRTDVLKVQVELARVEQELVVLEGRSEGEKLELAHAIGLAEFALRATDWVPAEVPIDVSESDLHSLQSRSDLMALRQDADSAASAAESIRAEERMPVIDLLGQHFDRKGSALEAKRENSVGIQLSIALFSAGTNDLRQLAKLRERNAAEMAHEDALKGAQRDLVRARIALRTATHLRRLADLAIASATESLERRRAMYDMGRATIDELLSAEAEAENQAAMKATAEIDALQAWLECQYLLGVDLASLNLSAH